MKRFEKLIQLILIIMLSLVLLGAFIMLIWNPLNYIMSIVLASCATLLLVLMIREYRNEFTEYQHKTRF
jgi:cytochrome c oxidase subunit IV